MSSENPLTAELERPNLPPEGGPTTLLLRIDPPAERAVTHREIVLCIDTSGSMETDDRIEAAKDAAYEAVGLLADGDQVSVVTFDTEAAVVSDLTELDSESRGQVQDTIDKLDTGGSTNVPEALDTSHQVFSDDPDAAQWLLFLSDGKDKTQLSNEEIGDVAATLAGDGVTVQPAGIGDADEELIQILAERGTGCWAEMEDTDEIKNFFATEVENSLQVAETNLKLQFSLPNGGSLGEVKETDPQLKVLSPEPTPDGYVLPLPDLERGRVQSILLEFEAPEHEEAESVPVLDVSLSTNTRSVSTRVTANYTTDRERQLDYNELVTEQRANTEAMQTIIEKNPDDMEEVEDVIEGATRMAPSGGEELETLLEKGAETIIEEGHKGVEKATKMDTVIEDEDSSE